MQRNLYSIRDAKSEIFNPPFHASTPGEAERAFSELVNRQGHAVNQYPEDFDLYKVAIWDDHSGKLTGLETPEHIVKAVQVLRPKQ